VSSSLKYSALAGEDAKNESDAKENCQPVAVATPGSLLNASSCLNLWITYSTRLFLVASFSES